ncbi:phosphatidylinositol glycan, class Q [Mytilus galloprovincialis]|uniref:Phosphatidylinositol glycan, class Q n=1 Tax=Mytilus galloprovincialis TaxID=29158 RepID=A0A8B6GT33_MYTGA|nr:phosphatidylinositol glycan, class Q [Mytilus galloprovincialis]VDI68688.1 phosphatidylinositol glycan, class Q [Mytilus galloprovincialis]
MEFKDSFSINKENNVWTVFIPYQFLSLPSCQLYGKVNRNCHRIYVLSVGMLDNNLDAQVVGEWTCDISQPIRHSNKISSENIWISVYKLDTGQLDCILLSGKSRTRVDCILFNPQNILESYFLQSSDMIQDENNMIQPLVSYSTVICDNENQHHSASSQTINYLNNINMSSIFLQVLTVLYSILTVLIDNRFTRTGLLKSITEIPSFCQHLILKKKKLYSAKTSKNKLFETQNVVSQTVLDVLLGILVMVFLTQNGWIDSITTHFFLWTEKVASELDILLNWLMGAPAGLKLNKPLTEFLGHFFMYHIYLWKGYLHLLKPPVFNTLLWCSSCVGVLGLSAQICLLKDIISTTTLHIYCYYVYAARLYRLQVYVLSALWRLFRGKKWNVLRRRVDSASFDVDQLFVGTLLFTIFLFLLPTTALYYTVFTLLRMVVLLFQGFLSTVVYIINHVPMYSILLWVIGSNKVSGEISLEVVLSDKMTDCQVFSLQVHKVPLRKIMKMSSSNQIDSMSQPLLSWKHFLLNLMKGHLVYPWIDLHKKL